MRKLTKRVFLALALIGIGSANAEVLSIQLSFDRFGDFASSKGLDLSLPVLFVVNRELGVVRATYQYAANAIVPEKESASIVVKGSKEVLVQWGELTRLFGFYDRDLKKNIVLVAVEVGLPVCSKPCVERKAKLVEIGREGDADVVLVTLNLTQ